MQRNNKLWIRIYCRGGKSLKAKIQDIGKGKLQPWFLNQSSKAIKDLQCKISSQ